MSLFCWSLPSSATVFVVPAAFACPKCFWIALIADSSTGSASGWGGTTGPDRAEPPAARLLLLDGCAALPPVAPAEVCGFEFWVPMPSRSSSPPCQLEAVLAAPATDGRREREPVAVVPAADDAHDRDATAHALVDDVAVALEEAGMGQLQVAQRVRLVHVDARVVQHELRPVALEHRGQRRPAAQS